MVRFYAHTSDRRQWEPLERHLQEVAELAAVHAAAFDAAEWASLLGCWHDAGKYSLQFQRYLRDSATNDKRRGPDHSTAGAQLALEQLRVWGGEKVMGRLLAYAIAGHHAGLADWIDQAGGSSDLRSRLRKAAPEIADALMRVPAEVRDQARPSNVPRLIQSLPEATDPGIRLAFFGRLLFSALVDADYLATERYASPRRQEERLALGVSMAALGTALRAEHTRLSGLAASSSSVVSEVRSQLLDDCRDCALKAPGLFSLTAPTGAGKTLSSLAFALEHARVHGLERVIYALPFTSVTEQVADEFRRVFAALGDRVVLEHHSSAERSDGTDGQDDMSWHRLAAENWDAPIVVTTNVQLLESLFASRPGKCRKLHRIAKSVVVLDEAQALPVSLMQPTLIALDELSRGYGASIVFSSATQPALGHRPEFPIGLRDVREIARDPIRLAIQMRRVEMERPGILMDDALADCIVAEPRSLAIVNTKRHAASLFQLVSERCPEGQVRHLSAAMCAAHRSKLVAEIKWMLREGRACRVISTQVVEAGVDIDFPVVFRAMAGLDSIVQAAGRCNREGKMKRGRLIVFETDVIPPPLIRSQAADAVEILRLHADPLSLEAVEAFFRRHYWQRKAEWDKHRIVDLLSSKECKFQYRDAARLYRVIDDGGYSVVVPYEEKGREICNVLRSQEIPGRSLMRTAQRYIVTLRERDWLWHLDAGSIDLIGEDFGVLMSEELYDADLGLRPAGALPAPEGLVL